MKLYGLIVGLLLVATAASKKSYSGYQTWRIQLGDEIDNKHIQSIIEQFNLDVWMESRTHMDVMITPENLRVVRSALARNRIHWDLHITDVGKLVAEEEERLTNELRIFSLTDYNTFEDIETYLTDLAATNDLVTLASIGQTVEGRDLWQVKISSGGQKPSIWIDCNIHAREWIGGATCLYGIDLLSGSYGSDADVTALVDKYDVFILPINNPDGYAYTWSNDRMWRKNRNQNPGDNCFGVDNNRNFDDHFGGEGTSGLACSETYRGPSPASELETQAVQNGIIDLRDNAALAAVFSIHSYSQLWMYPYGWTSALPPDADELDRVAQIGASALTAVHGTRFTVGPVATTIYPAASTTIDYSYSVGITQSHTLELRDTGTYGFILPPEQITPVGEETWAGLIASIMAI